MQDLISSCTFANQSEDFVMSFSWATSIFTCYTKIRKRQHSKDFQLLKTNSQTLIQINLLYLAAKLVFCGFLLVWFLTYMLQYDSVWKYLIHSYSDCAVMTLLHPSLTTYEADGNK